MGAKERELRTLVKVIENAVPAAIDAGKLITLNVFVAAVNPQATFEVVPA
jgi:hypothetical protein